MQIAQPFAAAFTLQRDHVGLQTADVPADQKQILIDPDPFVDDNILKCRECSVKAADVVVQQVTLQRDHPWRDPESCVHMARVDHAVQFVHLDGHQPVS